MGRCPTRKVKKRRLSHKTARRDKFEVKGDDLVYTELRKPDSEMKPFKLDEDLPGMGQFYCLHCDRYFSKSSVRDDHFKTKKHQKRVKMMNGAAPHSQLDADLAGGMGMPDNGPKLMSVSFQVDEDLPEMGQFYCLHCDRHFSKSSVRDHHFMTKKHQKRVKRMGGPAPDSQLDADLAGGMEMQDNGPKLMSG